MKLTTAVLQGEIEARSTMLQKFKDWVADLKAEREFMKELDEFAGTAASFMEDALDLQDYRATLHCAAVAFDSAIEAQSAPGVTVGDLDVCIKHLKSARKLAKKMAKKEKKRVR